MTSKPKYKNGNNAQKLKNKFSQNDKLDIKNKKIKIMH